MQIQQNKWDCDWSHIFHGMTNGCNFLILNWEFWRQQSNLLITFTIMLLTSLWQTITMIIFWLMCPEKRGQLLLVIHNKCNVALLVFCFANFVNLESGVSNYFFALYFWENTIVTKSVCIRPTWIELDDMSFHLKYWGPFLCFRATNKTNKYLPSPLNQEPHIFIHFSSIQILLAKWCFQEHHWTHKILSTLWVAVSKMESLCFCF